MTDSRARALGAPRAPDRERPAGELARECAPQAGRRAGVSIVGGQTGPGRAASSSSDPSPRDGAPTVMDAASFPNVSATGIIPSIRRSFDLPACAGPSLGLVRFSRASQTGSARIRDPGAGATAVGAPVCPHSCHAYVGGPYGTSRYVPGGRCGGRAPGEGACRCLPGPASRFPGAFVGTIPPAPRASARRIARGR